MMYNKLNRRLAAFLTATLLTGVFTPVRVFADPENATKIEAGGTTAFTPGAKNGSHNIIENELCIETCKRDKAKESKRLTEYLKFLQNTKREED